MTDSPVPRPFARYRLGTFGALTLLGPEDDTVLGKHGHHRRRLALLAVLAAAGEAGRSRDQLLPLFWPDATESRARHSLDQLLYALRSSIGESVFVGVNLVSLNPELVTSDVEVFNAALGRGDFEAAVDAYRGPFLDGFYLSDAPEFERWVERERSRLATAHAEALERLARNADAAQDHASAVRWWRRLTDADPLSNRNAAGFMRALINAGDHLAALQYADHFEEVVATEFGTTAGPAVEDLVAQARALTRMKPDSASTPADSPFRGQPSAVHLSGATTSAEQHQPEPARRHHVPARLIGALLVVVLLIAVTVSLQRVGSAIPSAATKRSIAVLPLARAAAGDFSPAKGTPLDRPPTRSLAAYELYRRGSDGALLRSDSAARVGLEYFRQAVALDSTYAAAWVGLARMHVRLSTSVGSPDRERYLALAEEFLRKALALDDSLAEGHATLGGLRMISFDFASAERHLTRAIELDPSSSLPHEKMVTLDLWMERPEEALAHAQRALALEPLSPSANAEVASALLGNDRCDEALQYLEKLSRLKPPLLRAVVLTSLCQARRQRWPEAIAVLRPSAEGGVPFTLGLLGYLFARSGNREEALRIESRLLDQERLGRGVAFEIALLNAGLRDFDKAIMWLERAIADRSLIGAPGLPNTVAIMGPLFEDLRRNPRFENVRARLGLQKR